jgi:uncharacterized damage-inducible protein DinB
VREGGLQSRLPGIDLSPVGSNLSGAALAQSIVLPCAANLGKKLMRRDRRTQHLKEDVMRRTYVYFLLLTVLALNFMPSGRAQESPDHKAPAMAAAAPTSGFRAEFLEEVNYYEQRYTRLAEAMPAEKYTWRPAEGVRSVGEVFTHIVAANYGVARVLGTAPPAGIDFKAIMGLSSDKPKVLQAMKDSFAHFRGAIIALNEADADKPQKMFNRSTTLRGSFIVITGHFGEHLGQSIAYARVNGVVPPWTEESQQQQQQKPADKPKP